MNENHAKVCTSPEWAQFIQTEVLPSLTRDVDLGDRMLEIGPGPGAATEWLRTRAGAVTAIEVDEAAAALLADRYANSNVEIVAGSAGDMIFPAATFDSVGCFTMLHHVPTLALQNKILAEALRVLRPGGVLIGSDSLPSNDLHHFHADDTYNPVDPASLLSRLQTVGFGHVTVTVDHLLKFIAVKPSEPQLPDPAAEDAAEGAA
jgi:ubiquinone/menaquinone biosynthesis C-methylase UbiE